MKVRMGWKGTDMGYSAASLFWKGSDEGLEYKYKEVGLRKREK